MTTPSSNVGADASRGHTPGPWEVYHDGFCIAAADGHILSTYVEGSMDSEAEANAALIAAAPDMLTLIEDIEQSLTADDTYRLLREACRKVIAKARPTPTAGETK